MARTTKYILLLLTSVLFACNKQENKPQIKEKFRTVLVYLSANNNLQTDAKNNLEQMEETLADIDGNLIVYAKLPNELAALYEINPKKDNKSGIKLIKEYPRHDSSDPMVMHQVTREVQNLYPAKSQGLILWSHATGWIPASQGGIKLKSFGDDNGSVMDITDLNNALPNNYDFIMFDACSMASVEVLYEIKDKAKIFIASPAEVISNGMPYNKITNDLFTAGNQTYTTIAQKYYNHYNNLAGAYRSATVSVINASELTNLAAQTKATLQSQAANHTNFNRDNIQRMDFDREYNPLIAFDFMDFITQNYNSSAVSNLQQTVNNLILYKANTPFFNAIQINTNSGITCYIPHNDNQGNTHQFYRTLKWYKDSGFDLLF